MVLKVLTHDCPGGGDRWDYYDGIETASYYYDANAGASCISMKFKGTDSNIVFALNDIAYLCNDQGRTIEKLYPKIRDAQ